MITIDTSIDDYNRYIDRGELFGEGNSLVVVSELVKCSTISSLDEDIHIICYYSR